MGTKDQSYENLRYLLNDLIDLRRRVPREISDMYAKNAKEKLKCLRNVNIKLQSDEVEYEIPENFLENIVKHISQPDEKNCDKIYEQIQFLSILLKKRKCSISKIIDEI